MEKNGRISTRVGSRRSSSEYPRRRSKELQIHLMSAKRAPAVGLRSLKASQRLTKRSRACWKLLVLWFHFVTQLKLLDLSATAIPLSVELEILRKRP